MSLKKILFSYAKQKDKERASMYRNQNTSNNYKYDAIDYSDKYFELEDEGNDYENRFITHYYVNDENYSEAVDNHAKVAEKWLELAGKMELLPVPDLPSKARQVFIDSHNMIIKSASLKAEIHLLNMKRILADLEDNLDLSQELNSQIKKIEELIYEMHKAYRNAFDDLLYYLDNC